MIRDIRWAYELGFKRGWKVGNRRGRRHLESRGEVDKSVFNVSEEPLINEILSEGSDISASGVSDTLPEYECEHVASGLISETDGILEIMDFDFCPWCGEKL